MSAAIDITGQRFGRLVAIERVPSVPKQPKWLCRCECGVEKAILSESLRKGRTRSCGCLHRQMVSAAASKRNRRELLTYGGAHDRIKYERGSASEYDCRECGTAAQEWAYDHADPAELTEDRTDRTGRAYVVPYSLDPDHYQPMCAPCHRIHDRALRTKEMI